MKQTALIAAGTLLMFSACLAANYVYDQYKLDKKRRRAREAGYVG
jgi:4-hydroxybenzoate polyprenyltransferase